MRWRREDVLPSRLSGEYEFGFVRLDGEACTHEPVQADGIVGPQQCCNILPCLGTHENDSIINVHS